MLAGMTSFARRERLALCDTALREGPDAPTLCEPWDVKALVCHLLVRERNPVAAAGIAISPLAGVTGHAMERWGRTDFGVLVERFRSPWAVPFAIPGVEQVWNTLEFLVHHEDIRRAQPDWAPRSLAEDDEHTLWSQLRVVGRGLARPAGVPVRLEWGSRSAIAARRRRPRRAARTAVRDGAGAPGPGPCRRPRVRRSGRCGGAVARRRSRRLSQTFRISPTNRGYVPLPFRRDGHTPQSAHGHTNGARALQASAVQPFRDRDLERELRGTCAGVARQGCATPGDVAQAGIVEAETAVRSAPDDVAVVVVLAVVVPPALPAALDGAALAQGRVPAARAGQRAARARREHVVLTGVPRGPTFARLCQLVLPLLWRHGGGAGALVAAARDLPATKPGPGHGHSV